MYGFISPSKGEYVLSYYVIVLFSITSTVLMIMRLTVFIICFVLCFDKLYVDDEHLNIRTLADSIINLSGVVDIKHTTFFIVTQSYLMRIYWIGFRLTEDN